MKPATLIPVFAAAFLLTVSVVLAQVPLVHPQEAGPNGELVHVVQYGDTLEGIMAAYAEHGVTLERLQELNGWRFPPQFIFVGDVIVILPPGSLPPGSGASAPTDAPVAPPSAPSDGAAQEPAESAAPASTENLNRLTAAEIDAMQPVVDAAPFLPIVGAGEAVETDAAPEPTASPETTLPEDTAVQTPSTADESGEPTAIPAAPVEEAAVNPAPTEIAEVDQNNLAVDSPSPADEMPNLAETRGAVCVTLFDDQNQNARRETDEALLAGGQVLIGDVDSQPTNDELPLCVTGLPTGRIPVSVAAPDGYGVTTAQSYQVTVVGGRTSLVSFGASSGYALPAAPPAEDETLGVPVPVGMQVTEVTAEAESGSGLFDALVDNSAYIVLGLACVVIVVGGVIGLRFVR